MIANGLQILHMAGIVLGGAISQDTVKVRLSADGIKVFFDNLVAYLLTKECVSRHGSSSRLSDLSSEQGAASQQYEQSTAEDSSKAADIYALG